MKKTILQSILLVTFLFLDFVAFAQGPAGPGNDDGSGGLEEEDPAAPINGKLIWLAIIGIAYVYYRYEKTQAVRTSK